MTVIYSSSKKLSGKGSQGWTQASSGISGTTEYRDYFGDTLAAGTSPATTETTWRSAQWVNTSPAGRDVGSVHLLLGTSSGLTATGSQTWSLPTVGAPAGHVRLLRPVPAGQPTSATIPTARSTATCLIGTFSSRERQPPEPGLPALRSGNGVGAAPVAVDESLRSRGRLRQGRLRRPGRLGRSRPGQCPGVIRRPTSTTVAPPGLDQTGPQVLTVGNYDLPSEDWVASGALSAAGSP